MVAAAAEGPLGFKPTSANQRLAGWATAGVSSSLAASCLGLFGAMPRLDARGS